MAADTVANIVSDAAAELGLGTVSDVFAATDTNVVQLRTLLTSVGQSLVNTYDWTLLENETTITTRTLWMASTAYSSATPSVVANGLYYYTCTVSGTSASSGGPTHTSGSATDGTVTWSYTGRAADFALPADFNGMIDQTGWNRTSRLPLGGPLSPQEWQYLKGRIAGVVFTVLFRPVQNVMRLYPDSGITGGLDIRYEYRSRYWLAVTAAPTIPAKGTPTLNTDMVLLDRLVVVRALKLAFLRAKGFPSQAAQEDFDIAVEDAQDADGSSPVLSLSRGGTSLEPLLGGQSIPITGYGS